ncbi:hypothetical protein [Cupriavidus pauculus]|uniref:hypothetical protein n=1 Tax=Cupriavidus pauculus TaxID=82633 RepID=UPI000FFB7642|nr:hypothetical protein [Cupriavidus pauculus]
MTAHGCGQGPKGPSLLVTKSVRNLQAVVQQGLGTELAKIASRIDKFTVATVTELMRSTPASNFQASTSPKKAARLGGFVLPWRRLS